ncbi:MAG: hypothetical protein LQ350_001013 [Teloschistes chrysophthalmus]|nr:MAG: hypothetical protein LQ350_001013 [Niorma chrysophthalma]
MDRSETPKTAVGLSEGETRILMLRPSKTGDVVCELRPLFPSRDAGTYSALSYAWGDPKDTENITVEGKDFPVTRNLKSALINLVNLGDPLPIPLWVDAICINQHDDEENRQQLGLMSDIYRKATNAIVWLGPEADDSSIAMQSLIKLAQYCLEHKLHGIDIGKARGNSAQWTTVRAVIGCLDFAFERSNEIPLRAIQALLERSWWSPVWTLQEFALAKDVDFRCGSDRLTWQQLWYAMKILFLCSKLETPTVLEHIVVIGPMVRNFYRSRAFRVSLQEKAHSNGTLFRAMSYAYQCGSECSDHRDYVYGVLGMANDEAAKSVVVNYATLTVKNVFVQATKQLLRVHGLDLLRYCYFRAEKRDVELPSWVPQWNGLRVCGLLGSRFRSQRRASSGLPRAVEPVSLGEHDTITLGGVAIDTIVSFADRVQDHDSMNEWLQELRKMIQNSEIYTSLHERMEAVWRTPCADTIYDGHKQLRKAQSKDGQVIKLLLDNSSENLLNGKDETTYVFEDVSVNSMDWAKIRCSIPKSKFHKHGDTMKRTRDYVHSVVQPLPDWRVFATEKGYLGLGPSTAQLGDHVCIFATAGTPHILRPVKTGSDSYRLIDEAYVHGLMKGECKANKLTAFTLI